MVSSIRCKIRFLTYQYRGCRYCLSLQMWQTFRVLLLRKARHVMAMDFNTRSPTKLGLTCSRSILLRHKPNQHLFLHSQHTPNCILIHTASTSIINRPGHQENGHNKLSKRSFLFNLIIKKVILNSLFANLIRTNVSLPEQVSVKDNKSQKLCGSLLFKIWLGQNQKCVAQKYNNILCVVFSFKITYK